MVPYDEMAYFADNAAEVGLAWHGPPVVKRTSVPLPDGRRLSGLRWGDGPPQLVLLHGGAQNAHTWDTVALALDRPLVALDLPGHGHSDGFSPLGDGGPSPESAAADVAEAVSTLAPGAAAVVGMSFGGLSAIALAAGHPGLVRKLALVDITPGVTAGAAAVIMAFVQGPESFDDLDQLLARTMEFNPTRTESSLRRGVLHNARQRSDGTWVWRYRRATSPLAAEQHRDHRGLWGELEAVTVPVLLVRGMREQSVVSDDDEARLLRCCAGAEVVHVDNAGHSVQGDAPLRLAEILGAFLAT